MTKMGTAADCGFDSTNPSADYDPSVGLETLEVVVHILMDDTCTQGVVSDATVHTQMDILNEDFLAISGSPGAGGVDTQIQFVLADEDPDGNPTTGITRDCNTTWYNDQGEYWETLAWDPDRYINIYVNTAGGAGGYVPFLPSASNADIGSTSDRVVINQLGFGPGGPVPARDQGRLTTHEVGHYLGLFHPYFGGCGVSTAPDCYTTGDRICDTEPDDTSHSGCPVGQTACGGFTLPATNYMELTDDSCKDRFTLEQARRMRCTLEFYRPDLTTGALCDGVVCDPGEVCDEVSGTCVATDPVLWMSFRSNTTVPGVGTVADEDIVSYDESTDTWALEFDGS
ncbi:MAG: M43 family zinc metalloprotease, partial [Acidobacteriota bacterium]